MNTKIRISLVLLLLIIIGITTWFFYSDGLSDKKIRNVLLISIDTCRADYLGCYGYPGKTTPNIDKLARQSTLFENVISPAPLTLPAHSSMLTGTNPLFHQVRDNFGYQVGPYNVTLAEILRERGYQTGAIVSTYVLDSKFGLDQGFDSYYDDYERREDDLDNGRIAEETSRLACEWLAEHKSEKFFLFLHFYDPHAPYRPPEPFASKFWDNLYAGEIAYTDKYIGEVIEKLKELGLYDSTLLIITGDHGEMLGEHRETGHGYYIYQSAVKVPLIIRVPKGSQGRRIDDMVGLIDIAPTIYSYLGIGIPSDVQGKDLSSYFRGKGSTGNDRYLYCESLTPTKYGGNPLQGVVTDRWKYIRTTRPELYDLANDPGERNNLVHKQPKRAHLLQGNLKLILEEQSYKGQSESSLTPDAESRKRLESLGYVASAGIDESYEFDQSKTDPKDLISLHERFARLQVLVITKQYEQAKLRGDELLAEYPDFLYMRYVLGEIAFELGNMDEVVVHYSDLLSQAAKEQTRKSEETIYGAHYKLAQALYQLNRFEESIVYFNEALRIKSDQPAPHCNLGNALFQVGKFNDALEQYREALRLNPDDDTLLAIYDGLAKVFFRQNRFDQALEHWSRMLKLRPDQPAVLSDMGVALAQKGKLDEAIECWNKSLQIEPNQAEVFSKIGTALAYQNNLDEAVRYWNKSLHLEPNQAPVHNRVGKALASLGKIDDALSRWARSLQIDPNQPELHANLGSIFNQQGNSEKAIYHWNKALELKPDWPEVLNNLAWLLAVEENAQLRNPTEALRLAQRACVLTDYKEPSLLDTLSVAYAGAGRFAEAIETVEKAIELALSSGQKELAEEIRKHLELYKKGRAYRE